MAELQEKIQQDIKQAMKNKEQVKLSALRMLKSEMQYELTKTGAKELSNDDVMSVIKRAVKKRKDSIEQFTDAGRSDLAETEQQELDVLKVYLPEEVSEETIKAIIDEVFSKMNPQGPSDMGKIMGAVMGRLKGQTFDGTQVNKLVKQRLEG